MSIKERINGAILEFKDSMNQNSTEESTAKKFRDLEKVSPVTLFKGMVDDLVSKEPENVVGFSKEPPEVGFDFTKDVDEIESENVSFVVEDAKHYMDDIATESTDNISVKLSKDVEDILKEENATVTKIEDDRFASVERRRREKNPEYAKAQEDLEGILSFLESKGI